MLSIVIVLFLFLLLELLGFIHRPAEIIVKIIEHIQHLSLVFSHQLTFSQNMAIHAFKKLRFCYAGVKLKDRIKKIKENTMRKQNIFLIMTSSSLFVHGCNKKTDFYTREKNIYN
jgi:hypothetical protein